MAPQSPFTSPRLLKRLIPFILSLIVLAYASYGAIDANAADPLPSFQAAIHLEPIQSAPRHQKGQIQPGTPVRFTVTVKNTGQVKSPAGTFYLRYALASPLEKESGSVIFETEKKPLPAVEAGQQIEIALDTPHPLPSLLDFVRDDWSMREYQAIILVDGRESVVGTLALTVSAHYYAQET